LPLGSKPPLQAIITFSHFWDSCGVLVEPDVLFTLRLASCSGNSWDSFVRVRRGPLQRNPSVA